MPSDAASYSRRRDITPTQLQKRISSPTGICFTKMSLFLLQTNLFSLDDTKLFHHLVLVRITNALTAGCAFFNWDKIKKLQNLLCRVIRLSSSLSKYRRLWRRCVTAERDFCLICRNSDRPNSIYSKWSSHNWKWNTRWFQFQTAVLQTLRDRFSWKSGMNGMLLGDVLFWFPVLIHWYIYSTGSFWLTEGFRSPNPIFPYYLINFHDF
jgi:hypothetical protein